MLVAILKELPENGYQPKHVGARYGEIYISVIRRLQTFTVHGENTAKGISSVFCYRFPIHNHKKKQ
jgi:hypothetical protein